MLLTEIKPGNCARIVDMSGESSVVQRRLVDLYFVEGSVVSVKRKLPFQGPVVIEANGQCNGIRHQEAKRIEVERL